ncbi:MAG: ROK family protein [Bacteroidales bacterium]|nr:ROK family protein [Bacteroidales bacterium]
MNLKNVLGMDIGGSGIKAAPVNVKTGKLLDEKYRIPTPDKSTPEALAAVIVQHVKHFKWKGAIGCGFPAVVQNGVVCTAANIDSSWIGTNGNKLFSKATGLPVWLLNDADAAGLAEIKLGAGAGFKGAILVVTVGTGIGSALFVKGRLYPNSELGHIFLKGQQKDAEYTASDAARKRDDLSWDSWGERFNAYLTTMENLFWPELIIIGGGVSKKMDKFRHQLKLRAKVEPALLLNEAGIVGAAIAARVYLKNLLNG